MLHPIDTDHSILF